MDLVETDEHFVLRADLPGLRRRTSSIEVEDNVLTLSGERKSEHEESREGYYRVERAFGRFSRSLTLPEGVDADAIDAVLRPRRARGPHPQAGGAQAAPDQIGVGGTARRSRAPRRPRPSQRPAPRSPSTAGPPRGSRRAPPDGPATSGARRVCRLGARWRRPPSRSSTRDPGSRARAGMLQPRPRRGPHARVRAAGHQGGRSGRSRPREVAALGYDMVLGNTFHLFLAAGPRR